jgi:hypothetical protein
MLRPSKRRLACRVSVTSVIPDTDGAVIRLISSYRTVQRQRWLDPAFPRCTVFYRLFVLRQRAIESQLAALHAYQAIREVEVSVIMRDHQHRLAHCP